VVTAIVTYGFAREASTNIDDAQAPRAMTSRIGHAIADFRRHSSSSFGRDRRETRLRLPRGCRR
jgi:hypothetical protein